jgi:hypothetical protein
MKHKNRFLFILYIMLILIVVGAILFGYSFIHKRADLNDRQAQALENKDAFLPEIENAATPEFSPGATIPLEYDLRVPFVVQAPFSVWDDLHENALRKHLFY